MSKKLKIAVYTIGSRDVPSTRFRVIQYLPLFESAGIKVKVFTLPSMGRGRFSEFFGSFVQAAVRFFQLLQASAYDRIVVQKGLTPWRAKGFVKLLRCTGRPFILDLDDTVYLKNPVTFPGALRRLQDDKEPLKLIQAAAQVMAGNAYLAEFVAGHNASCTVIPTAVDTDQYGLKKSKAGPRIVIGWSGSSSTNFLVNQVIPVLNRLAEKYTFDFYVMSQGLKGIETQKMKGYGFRFFEWSEKTEMGMLEKIDIGLMPLEDSPWARGKCGLKALLYMALGIVPVCSPVGVNPEIIQDGINGFLAGGPEEWFEKLRLLIEDPPLRERMGREARTTVEKRYSIRGHFTALKAVIENGCRVGGR